MGQENRKPFKRSPVLALAQFTWLKPGVNEIEGPNKFDNLRVANDSWCKAPLCDYVVISNWIMPVECILPGLNAGT